MMTVSGIAAEGLSPDVETRRIAAESVSPQLVAVLGHDTELCFAMIPVIIKFLLICAYKGKQNILSGKQFFKERIVKNAFFFWLCKNLRNMILSALPFYCTAPQKLACPYFLRDTDFISISLPNINSASQKNIVGKEFLRFWASSPFIRLMSTVNEFPSMAQECAENRISLYSIHCFLPILSAIFC